MTERLERQPLSILDLKFLCMNNNEFEWILYRKAVSLEADTDLPGFQKETENLKAERVYAYGCVVRFRKPWVDIRHD